MRLPSVRHLFTVMLMITTVTSMVVVNRADAADHHGASSVLKVVSVTHRSNVYIDTDYCHPVARRSKWWRCDGVSLARWLHDHPVAPQGIHPIPRPKG